MLFLLTSGEAPTEGVWRPGMRVVCGGTEKPPALWRRRTVRMRQGRLQSHAELGLHVPPVGPGGAGGTE